MRTVRVHDGIKLVRLETGESTFEDDELRPGKLGLPPRCSQNSTDEASFFRDIDDHVLLSRIQYSDAEDGVLIYLKPSFTGDEPLDLCEYRRLHHEFPHESTSDQAYDPDQVEAYRRLGYHIGKRVGLLFQQIRDGHSFWDVDVTTETLCQELLAERAARRQAEEPIDHRKLNEIKKLLALLRKRCPAPTEFPGPLHESLADDPEFSQWMNGEVLELLMQAADCERLAAQEREFAKQCLKQLQPPVEEEATSSSFDGEPSDTSTSPVEA